MTKNLSYLVLLVATTVAILTTGSDALAAKTKAVDQAVAIFGKQFPFGRPPVPSSSLVRLGMSGVDIDGTKLMKTPPQTASKRLTDITEKQARSNFNTLAQCYGEDAALGMVKTMPICLCFNAKNYKPSLAALGEIFGEAEAKGMVQRNPGLLAIKPEDAATTTAQTMYFSYLVAATRPVGGILLAMLTLALLSLPYQAATGIVVRDEIVKFLFKS
eukprot:scaffold1690_cov182-Amphora_coffeaeformis.AAC.23